LSPDEKFLKKVSTTKKFNVNNSMDIDLNNVEICSLTMTKMTNEMYKDIFLKNSFFITKSINIKTIGIIIKSLSYKLVLRLNIPSWFLDFYN